MKWFSGRLGLQQRMLPAYRAPFFDALAAACEGGLGVFAGKPLPEEAIITTDHLNVARYFPALNRNFFPVTSPLYQCWQSGLLQWLELWQPDVLIAEANARNVSTRLAVRWMHQHNRPVLGWGLGEPVIEGVFSRVRAWNRRSFILQFDGMIAYSQRGAEEYCRLGVPESRIFIARNAASPRPIMPPPQRPPSFGERPTVLFVGRLQRRKRIDNLLRACAALPESIQPRLVIVGEGPDRKVFEALAAQVYPSAEFTGSVHGSDLDPCYAAADLFVLPGTGGLAVQQAMAHGLPVIVAEADGTQGDMVREENGWVIPPDDLDALISVLRFALEDAGLLRQKGNASFRIVSEEINIGVMVDAFIGALQMITGGQ